MNKRQYARVVNRPGDFELQPFSAAASDYRPAQRVHRANSDHNMQASAFSSPGQASRFLSSKAERAGITDLLAPFRAYSAPRQSISAGDARAFDECFPEELLTQSAQYFNRMHLMAAVENSPRREVPLDFEPSFGEDLAAYEAQQSDISKSVALRQRRDVFYQTDNETADESAQAQPSVADKALYVFAAMESEIDERLRLQPMQISVYEYQEMQCAILTLQQQNAGLEQCSARRADEVFALQKRFAGLEAVAAEREQQLSITQQAQLAAEELLAVANAEKGDAIQRLEQLRVKAAAQEAQISQMEEHLEKQQIELENARGSVEEKYYLIISAKNRDLEQKERTICALQRMLCQYAAGARDSLSAAYIHSLELDNKSLRRQLGTIRAEEYQQIRVNTGPQGRVIALLARESCERQEPGEGEGGAEQRGPEGEAQRGHVQEEQQQAIESLLKHNAELRRVVDEQREQQRELLRRLSFLQAAE